MANFIWGDAGAQLTPEAIAAQRKIAQAMMARGADYSPIQSWTQGAARVAEGMLGGFDAARADMAERQNAASEKELLASLIGGGTTPAAAAPVAAAPAIVAPTGTDQAVYPTPPAAGPAPVTFRPGITAPSAPTTDTSVPRGIRNNNPLNIEAGTFTAGMPGFTGSDGRFARFETPEQGVSAADRLLVTYANKHGLNTVAGIVGRWAPTSDGNNVSAYAANVARQIGVDPNAPLDMNNPEIRRGLISAMGQHENGRPIQVASLGPAATASADPAALPVNAQSAEGYAIPSASPGVQAVAQASPALNPKLLTAMASPYVSDGTKKILGIMLTNQLSQDGVTPIDAGNKIILTDKRGNVIREIAKGEPNKGPEFGVIGKDAFGNEQYGWRDPRDKSTTPVAPAQGAAQPTITGSDGKPIPIPPGVDPKVIRDAASKRIAEESMPASSDTTSKLRNEIQGLPSYKNIAQAAPVYKSMLDAAARDNRAADVNIIYGMAKIMDPGSVVRESEMTVAQAIATLPQQIQAAVKSQMTESGRLTPELRAAIMTEARSRINAYQNMFDQDANMYRGIAQRGRMNEADVLPTFGPFDEFKPPTAAPTPAAIDDLVKKYSK